ncbi:hypothetical protein DEO72_LG9g3062 [Vigna unguiculata]|uniref:Uncharacterized protein n=1 Tax=Vigna unguiculata TaxID=3917 RepID=A0A4D6N429_VIGUN|nr:hypothetical protein DEO72_LG9g3062 [Vigna unguiculata]
MNFSPLGCEIEVPLVDRVLLVVVVKVLLHVGTVSNLIFSPRRVVLTQAKTPENPLLFLREVSPTRARVA